MVKDLTLVVIDGKLLRRNVWIRILVSYPQLWCLAELWISSLFDVKVSEVVVNNSITPCLASSVYVDKSLIGLIFASSYFLHSFLKELLFYRFAFFIVAAWFLLSAWLILVYDYMTHLPDQKPLSCCEDSHSGKHGCSYSAEEFLQVKLLV